MNNTERIKRIEEYLGLNKNKLATYLEDNNQDIRSIISYEGEEALAAVKQEGFAVIAGGLITLIGYTWTGILILAIVSITIASTM